MLITKSFNYFRRCIFQVLILIRINNFNCIDIVYSYLAITLPLQFFFRNFSIFIFFYMHENASIDITDRCTMKFFTRSSPKVYIFWLEHLKLSLRPVFILLLEPKNIVYNHCLECFFIASFS
jgi:hypothetical protein